MYIHSDTIVLSPYTVLPTRYLVSRHNESIICTLYSRYTRLPCVCENGENNFMTWLFDVCSLTSLEIRINNMPGRL